MSRSEFFSLRNLQGCCLLFNYQGSLFCCLIRDSHINISYVFSLVNNFFNLFLSSILKCFQHLSDNFYRISCLQIFVNTFLIKTLIFYAKRAGGRHILFLCGFFDDFFYIRTRKIICLRAKLAFDLGIFVLFKLVEFVNSC